MNGTHLPPDIALLAALAQKSLLAEAARAGDIRPPSREDAARHEAGHALGSALMGGGVRPCAVRQTRDGWTGQTVPAELTAWRTSLPTGEPVLTPAGAVARAFFRLAGPLAKRQQGGSTGPASLAADVREMLSADELLRSAIVLAALPEVPPANEEAIEPLQGAIITITFRVKVSLMEALRQEAPRLDAIAKALMTHDRLASHEVTPLLRGVASVSPEAYFDCLRQRLPVGPLPRGLPQAYRDATHARALGLDLG